MIANAAEAIGALRHARTGEVLATKNVARNTKLVYMDDEMVGLRYHNTIIARYLRDGVRIDTRDFFNPNGWFTMSTWERIGSFTPARTCTQNGLRYMVLDPSAGWHGPLGLYTHGTFVASNGSCGIPMEPALGEAITRVVNNWPRRLKRYAEKCVDAWRNWEQAENCCTTAYTQAAGEEDERYLFHLLEHFERGEPVVPIDAERVINPMRARGIQGEALSSQLAESLTSHFRQYLIPLAISKIEPNFPYPQLKRRAR